MTSPPEHAKNRSNGGLLRLAAMVVTVIAVVKELRTPAEERTWHGTVGFVPYDFRVPTIDRLRSRIWAPDSDQLFTPTAFGVGWSVNLARAVALLRNLRNR